MVYSVPLLALVLFACFVVNTYAYTLNSRGDLVSNNLLDFDLLQPFGNNLTFDNGSVSGYDTKSVFNFQVQFYQGNLVVSQPYSINVSSVGYVQYSFTKQSNIDYIQFGHNGSSNDIKVRYYINGLTNGSTYTISIYITSYSGTHSFDKIMLNQGSSRLAYEPYGVFINSKYIPSGSSIRNNLIGTNVKVFPNSSYNSLDYYELSYYKNTTPTMSDVVVYNDDTLNYDLYKNNFNIYQYGMNSQSSSVPNRLALFYSFTNPLLLPSINFYLNGGDDSGTSTIVLYFTDNTYQVLLISEGDENNNKSVTFVNTYNKGITNIVTTMHKNMHYVDFGVSDITSVYNSGFNNGYYHGSKDGYKEGLRDNSSSFNDGYKAGYDDGYIDGTEDYEEGSLGFMVTSIVEAPINIFKDIFSFNVLGLNIAELVLSLVTVLVTVFIIKRFTR